MTGFEMIVAGADSVAGQGSNGRTAAIRSTAASNVESGGWSFAGLMVAALSAGNVANVVAEAPTGKSTDAMASEGPDMANPGGEAAGASLAQVAGATVSAAQGEVVSETTAAGEPGSAGETSAARQALAVVGEAKTDVKAKVIGAVSEARRWPAVQGVDARAVQAGGETLADRSTASTLQMAAPDGAAEGLNVMDRTRTVAVQPGVASAAGAPAVPDGPGTGAVASASTEASPSTSTTVAASEKVVLVRGPVDVDSVADQVPGDPRTQIEKPPAGPANSLATDPVVAEPPQPGDTGTMADQKSTPAVKPADALEQSTIGVSGIAASESERAGETAAQPGATAAKPQADAVSAEERPVPESAEVSSRWSAKPEAARAANGSKEAEPAPGSASTATVPPARPEGYVRRTDTADLRKTTVASDSTEAGSGGSPVVSREQGPAGSGLTSAEDDQHRPAEDQSPSVLALGTERGGETRFVVPDEARTIHQTARVELKDLPQFVRKAQLVALGGGTTEMRVQLVPENLGRLSVHVSVSEGEVNARLVVESPEVKALVEERLPELERALRDQGLNLSGLSVGCGDTGTGQGSLSRQAETEWNGRNPNYASARRDYEDEPLGVAGPVPKELSHLWTAQGGLLDALA